jgi:hypothetical protein
MGVSFLVSGRVLAGARRAVLNGRHSSSEASKDFEEHSKEIGARALAEVDASATCGGK